MVKNSFIFWLSFCIYFDWESLEWQDQTLNIHWKDYAEAKALIFWPSDVKSWLITKDPDAGKDGRWRRRRDGWMASPTQWTWVWVNSGRRWLTGKPGVLLSMRSQRVEYQLSDWTELNCATAKPVPHILSFCFVASGKVMSLFSDTSFCVSQGNTSCYDR